MTFDKLWVWPSTSTGCRPSLACGYNWSSPCSWPTAIIFLINGSLCLNRSLLLSPAGRQKCSCLSNAHKNWPPPLDLLDFHAVIYSVQADIWAYSCAHKMKIKFKSIPWSSPNVLKVWHACSMTIMSITQPATLFLDIHYYPVRWVANEQMITEDLPLWFKWQVSWNVSPTDC